MPFKIQGNNAVNVNADATYSALQTVVKGVPDVTFDPASPFVDAFGRLRVSEPRIAFECSFANDAPATLWEATAYGAGTKTANTTAFQTELNTTTSTTTGYWLQSWNHVRYAPGISSLVRFTFCFNALIANVTARVGLFTDQGTFPSAAGDGVFLEAAGTGVNIVKRTLTGGGAGAEERVAQASWNLDKLNGTGTSGINLDWTLAQHLCIEFQFLGVGTVLVGFETSLGIVWAHAFSSSNAIATAWCRTGTLPLRAECYTTGAAASAGKLTLINCVLLQEGDVLEYRGYRYRTASSGSTAKLGGTAAGLYPLISLRSATTNDITKRALIVPTRISILLTVAATAGVTLQWALTWGPTTLAGASFAAATTDAAQVDTAATVTTAIAGGVAIFSGVFGNVANTLVEVDLSPYKDNLLRIAQNAAGSLTVTGNNILTLAAGPLTNAGAAGATFVATICWKEIV